MQRLEPPSVRVLDVELEGVLLSKAAQLGLPDAWVARLTRLDPQRRQVPPPTRHPKATFARFTFEDVEAVQLQRSMAAG